MSAAFEVLEPGLQTTVQDLGRPGAMAIGVPASGALDPTSLRLANRIAGNAETMAGLELRSPGPALRLAAPSARVALAGTSSALIIERDGEADEWPPWRAVDLREGDIVRVAAFADTALAYLAITGGIDVPEVFGSRSTFLRGGFGGLNGRALAIGDRLPLARVSAPEEPCLTLLSPPRFVQSATLRAVPGPQADHFQEEAFAALFGNRFTVSRDLDRMGMRLEGPELMHKGTADIVSDGTVPGALQVPGSRQPILLLADCQTIGGYAKIATVISADLPAAGRLLPGAEVRFRKVDVAEAEDARAEAEQILRHILSSLAIIREGARL